MENKEILEIANLAVAKGDYEGFLDFFTEDTIWNFVGDRVLEGKEQVHQYMKEVYLVPPKFTVERVIEQGDFVTVLGQISLKNTLGLYVHFDYCDNWRFENGKIAELKAFVIQKKA
ncbi:nuclear transport factor 2 family protein [Sphingobacterium sp. SYP-B4668]|uniref:nuclear transport factor 2 family protein n=1 Tax=Sphingobacterium sp. SYP-B4668 TaxID=2996035 RepID=UPI0022DDE182|nr:nuclear transport factor 2 family protein [Sphingobacterium sp. SYP-B4668]